jgi:quercetin dioxygenase-like cupin family protein
MLIDSAASVAPQQVQEGTRIRWLITEEAGAPNFAMRVIEIDPGVVFKPHEHPFEHEIYVLEGTGMLTNPDGDVGEMVPHKFVLVPPDEVHGYRNTGDEVLKFICVIPLQH